jgi:hypothetical protein
LKNGSNADLQACQVRLYRRRYAPYRDFQSVDLSIKKKDFGERVASAEIRRQLAVKWLPGGDR